MSVFVTLWDCKKCDTKGIFGVDPTTEEKINRCPNCGSPVPPPIPGKGVEGNPYYIPSGDLIELKSQYAKDLDKAGPNWECKYCNSAVSPLRKTCNSCGATKDAPYKDDTPVAKDKSVIKSKRSGNDSSYSYLPSKTKKQTQDLWKKKKGDSPVVMDKYGKVIAATVVTGLVGMIGLFLFLFLSTKDVVVTLDKFEWHRSIPIEKFKIINDGDWHYSIPNDAYAQSSRQKIHHYNKVACGTEQVAVTKRRPVTKTRYVNNGNGTGRTESYTDYESYTSYETRTKYCDEPVYDTWVDYKVNRWRFNNSVKVSAYNHSPYWPEVKVSASNPPKLGDTRKGSRQQEYHIHLHENDGERKWKQKVIYSKWKRYEHKQLLIVKVNFFNQIINGPFEAEGN